MVGPPRLHELGAKWVEVTVWERMKRRFNQRRNDLKRASNNPSISFRLGMMSKPEFPGRPCSPAFGGSSRARPAIRGRGLNDRGHSAQLLTRHAGCLLVDSSL